MDEASRSRKPYTPGWSQTLTKVEGLPIKSGNKIIPMLRTKRQREPTESDEEQEKIVDVEDLEGGKSKDKKNGKNAENQSEEVNKMKKEKVKKSKELVLTKRSPKQLQKLQQQVGELCLHITSNPEDCVLRRKKDRSADEDNGEGAATGNGADDEKTYHIQDLISLTQSNDVQELELALPSATLVFKDICPGYRIRAQEDPESKDGGQQLKKETKRLMDFEKLLLNYFQRFLAVLDDRIALGFGAIGDNLNRVWGSKEEIAFIALKCQCELLKSLHYFNFRNVLLASVLTRSTCNHQEVNEICCETLESILKNDVVGDLSFDFVSTFNKLLKIAKFQLPENVLKLLQVIKVSISVDEGKKYQILAKQQKKKRKKVRDEVELGLLEAEANTDEVTRKRYQVTALQEISLVYFRVIKQKNGFALFPTALEGLSKITHLLDIDTVADLMAVLKELLDCQSPVAPVPVRVMAIYCAMKTLSGPGSELKIDDEPYLMHFKQALRDIPLHLADSAINGSFTGASTWTGIAECIDLIFLKRREERNHLVASVVRILLFHSVHHLHDGVGPSILTLVHMMLLRYPRVRQETSILKTAIASTSGGVNGSMAKVVKTLAKQLSVMEEEDKVEDLAMKALKEGDVVKSSSVAADDEEGAIGDGTWLVSLMRHSVDNTRYKKIVDAMSSRDLLPLPLRLSDISKPTADVVMDRLNASLSLCPATFPGVMVSKPASGHPDQISTSKKVVSQKNNGKKGKKK
jgi:hypothetical protein